ncbi:hypothetical protein F5Y00DRAFT_231767 [Daldinia vernicosa]|uniref:uncharacterized protein n=1 Tax=Daldinia vernicosa TaxID=114800 RepID=UPI002007DB37|nr:uncharacterized protein F5Y00DRAFT_231767 [Daldinia vernicosa]KAI0850666.1 hypothetical protein F5Y00DRAFT_231767 [Daldinia vernicosa]
MPSIQDLPPELIAQVVDLIRQSSPETLSSISKLSPTFCKAVVYSQYHTRNFQSYNLDTKLKRIESNHMWRAIRCIEIDWFAGMHEYKAWHHLYKSLPKMTGLRDVKVDINGNFVDRRLIEALKGQPNIRLHVDISFDNDPSLESALSLLQNNLNLYSISADCDREVTAWDKCTNPFMVILLTCPHLRHLKFKIFIIHYTGSRYGDLELIDNERPPALETLKLDFYPFSDGEEYEWADSFDWSQMRRLQTRYTGLISRCPHKFTSLKEITLDPRNGELAATKQFFELVPSMLESVKVPSIDTIGMEGVSRHGSKLRILHISMKYSYSSLASRPSLLVDAGDLQRIRDSCPYLEELALSISNTTTMCPPSTLNVLASFPKLHTLELHFQLEPPLYMEYSHPFLDVSMRDDTVCKFFAPFVTISTVQQLFKRLLQTKSAAQTSALRELRVKYKASEDFYDGPVESWNWDRWMDDWLNDNDVSFQCKLSDQDVDKNRGVFSIICEELTEKENAILHEALDSNRDLAQILGDENQIRVVGQKFKIAWYGPLPRKDWESWRLQSRAYGIFQMKNAKDEIVVPGFDPLPSQQITQPISMTTF